jgi:hypothetical protein
VRRIRTTYIAIIGLCAILGSGQTSRVLGSSRVEITLPRSVASERLFVRYVLSGQDLGGAVYGPANVTSFGISTLADGHPADSMKAILYAPGCEIQTLDLKFTGSDSPRYSFICQRVPDLEIHGILARSDRLWRHQVRLQANYIAGWTESFLGLGDTLITSSPVGDPTDLSTDGRFRLLLPDFSQNPGRSGEFRIVAKDQTNEAVVAMLVPPKSVRTRMGGLVVRRDYADELIFTPCAASSARVHDHEGFAVRPDTSDSCDPF